MANVIHRDNTGGFTWQDADIYGNLQYVGFDPELIRKIFVTRAGVSWRSALHDLLIILASVGNNLAKLTKPGKVRNTEQGQKLAGLINNLQIVQSARDDKQALTLPRLGIAFSREFYDLMTSINNRTQGNNAIAGLAIPQRFACNIAAHHQQPSLIGLLAITQEDDARQFHEMFGKAVMKDWTQKKSDMFFDIAVNGARQDANNISSAAFATWVGTANNLVTSHTAGTGFHVINATVITTDRFYAEVIETKRAAAVANGDDPDTAIVNAKNSLVLLGAILPPALTAANDAAGFAQWHATTQAVAAVPAAANRP